LGGKVYPDSFKATIEPGWIETVNVPATVVLFNE
jgi:hypothetical protein